MASSEGIKIADRRASHMEDVPPSPAPAVQPQATPKVASPAATPKQTPQNPPHASTQPRDLPEEDFEAPEGEDEPGPDEEGDPRTQGGRGGPSPMALFAAPVREISSYFLEILLRKAWVCLGMMPDPGTGRRKPNPSEARLAIDLVGSIADQMSGKWGHPGMEAEIRNQLTNLRLHSAKASGDDPAKV